MCGGDPGRACIGRLPVMLCCNDEDVALQDEQIALVDPERGRPDHRAGRRRRDAEAHDRERQSSTVLIDRLCDGIDTDAVVLDNRRAVQDAASICSASAIGASAIFSGSLDTSTGRERLAGYRQRWKRRASPARGPDPDRQFSGEGRLHCGDPAAGRVPTANGGFLSQQPDGHRGDEAIRDIGPSLARRRFGRKLRRFSLGRRLPAASDDDRPAVQAIGEQAAQLVLDRFPALAGSAAPARASGRLVIRDSCRPAGSLAPRAIA